MRILTESASARIATPIVVRPDQIDMTALGYNPRERSWNYLQPWLGGTWRLRDIVDYQELAGESLLYNAALHREEMLRNFYKVGEDQVGARFAEGCRNSQRSTRSRRHPEDARDTVFRSGGSEEDSNGDYVIHFSTALFEAMQKRFSSVNTTLMNWSTRVDRPSGPTM